MRKLRWLVVLTALGLVATACGRDDDDDTAAPTTAAAAQTTAAATPTTGGGTETSGGPATTAGATTTTAKDPCAGVTLQATDTGVSADTITITVMADTGSALAPGLFQGSIDGTKAWGSYINAHGGLGCRKVEVKEADSKLDPNETTNGILKACADSLAMVGNNALFMTNVADLTSCPDKSGAPTGIADIAALAVAPAEQCSPVTFAVSLGGGSCPYSGSGPRDYKGATGAFKYLAESIAKEPLHGIFLVSKDLPTTKESSHATNASAAQTVNAVIDGEPGVGGRDDQSQFAPYVQTAQEKGSNLAYTAGTNDANTIKFRKEAQVQGYPIKYWYCGLSCYTEAFLAGGADVEGTYIGIAFVPFEEKDSNEELNNYMTAIGSGKPVSWGADSWAAGVLFKQVVDDIVATQGPNALTRKSILDGLRKVNKFDANGWFGSVDIGNHVLSNCWVLLQVKGGKFVRVAPEKPGTLDCNTPLFEGPKNFDSIKDFDG